MIPILAQLAMMAGSAGLQAYLNDRQMNKQNKAAANQAATQALSGMGGNQMMQQQKPQQQADMMGSMGQQLASQMQQQLFSRIFGGGQQPMSAGQMNLGKMG
jgi:hypothetical protein